VLSAVLSGASGWKSIQQFGEEQIDWLKQHRAFDNGIPRRHCTANIVKALDSEQLLLALMNWINETRASTGKQVLALDGKTMRSAWSKDVQTALHVVSAFDVDNGLALYQDVTDRKGKEPEVVRSILKVLQLKDKVITLDALHCQSETMNAIKAGKGDFMIQLKGNRRELNDAVKALFEGGNQVQKQDVFEEKSSGHGRQEYRKVTQMEARFHSELKKKWLHIKSVLEVEAKRSVNEKETASTRYFVSYLAINAEEAAKMIRAHWAIENKLHWVPDVVFREDELNVKVPDGAKHLAIFDRAALNVIKQHKRVKDSMAALRRKATWNPSFRSELIMG
jgi:predicted transposase YbfD/YdcC